tara:strand:+ start:1542 stop:2036 length:495 start_codon:yes stop_codon:yes gene_type:complete
MTVFIGGTEITDIQIGSTAINSVYVGANKVWDRVTSLDTQTVTVGEYISGSNPNLRGYGFGPTTGGSISDGTSNMYSGAAYYTIDTLIDLSNGLGWLVQLIINGTQPNSGWTTMTIDGVAFDRADISFHSVSSGKTYWVWGDSPRPQTNPFGTTAGITKQVVFT